MNPTVKKFAEAVKEAGGRAMLVGGCVRDELLGLTPKDIDLEVYGLELNHLEQILFDNFGELNNVGKSFAVYKLGQDIDISIPRRERKVGMGHRGFEVIPDPFMSFENASSRRDFTINAIMKDPLTDEIIDPWRGREALKNKTLRMVSPTSFQEDSLRVLRLVQFATRFGFGIETETAQFAQRTDLTDLPKERVWMELEKMFLKGKFIGHGYQLLFELGIASKLFPTLKYSTIVREGLDRNVIEDKTLSNDERIAVILAVMATDSAQENLELYLDNFGAMDSKIRNLVQGIFTVNKQLNPDFTDYELKKLAHVVPLKLVSNFLCATSSPLWWNFDTSIVKLGITEEAPKPVFMGRDLIEMGMKPSPNFGKILEEVYDRQLRSEVETLEEAKKFILASN